MDNIHIAKNKDFLTAAQIRGFLTARNNEFQQQALKQTRHRQYS